MHVHNTTTSTRDIIAARLCGRESRRVTGLEGRLAHTRERVRSHIDTQQLASVAQLGERSTEDAEVRISIILGGIRISFCWTGIYLLLSFVAQADATLGS